MKKLLITMLLLISTNLSAQSIQKNPTIRVENDFRKAYIALKFALEYTNYKETKILPKIIYTNISICDNTQCGIYNFDRNEIVMEDEDYGKEFNEIGLLIHELTHYLQYTNGIKAKNCGQEKMIEIEAYRVQAKYLQQYSIYFNPRDYLRQHICKEDYGKFNTRN